MRKEVTEDIQKKIKLLNYVVVFIVVVLLFLMFHFLYYVLDFITKPSIVSMLSIMVFLILETCIFLYLSNKISKQSVKTMENYSNKLDRMLNLTLDMQKEFWKKLQTAYEKEDYEQAKVALLAIKKELRLINESAVSSLEEGFEETLTVHRLGVPKGLRKSLKTTNVIESVLALVSQKTDKVDYWKNSDQKQRWVATALLDIEMRLNRVNGYRHLKNFRIAVQRGIL
jgi:HPt (histidine-containing phosphotransfer) domain-containing protein